MEDYSKYTPTELLVMINNVKISHDKLKQEIFSYLQEIENLSELINKREIELNSVEKQYVNLIEELNNR
jgi:hypothetical protein